MKVALPVVGGQLSPHFGHCEAFAFYDVEDGNITSKKNIPSPEHQPGLLPAWLAQQGATVVIAGGMGPRAVDLLEQNGITVVLGSMESDPEQAVLSFINNSLATGDNVCNHDDSRECAH